MAEEEHYQAWLEDFRQEFNTAGKRFQAPSSETGRKAQAAFESWWKSEFEAMTAGGEKPAPAAAARQDAPIGTKADLLAAMEKGLAAQRRVFEARERLAAAEEELNAFIAYIQRLIDCAAGRST